MDGHTEEQERRKEEIKALFDHLDVDKDGRISIDDFKLSLEKKGLDEGSPGGVEELYNKRRLLPNEKGGITFGEFYNMLVHDVQEEDRAPADPFSAWVLLGDNRVASAASKPQEKSMWKYLIYGALSGAISRTATAPLERLKILVQVQDIAKGGPKYSAGVIGSLIKMWKEEGFTGYFKGNGTNCVRIMPSSAVRLFSYEFYKKFLWGDVPAAALENYKRLISGGCAGITATMITHPLDLARTRLAIQTTEKRYSGLFGTILTVVKEEGITGIYKGMGTSCLGVAPFVALNFASCEALRELSKKKGWNQGVFSSLAIGSLGGTIAMTITYPTELLRRRMMIQGIGGEPRQYNSILDAVRKIAATEGRQGFYRGMVVTYWKVIPSTAISWAVMDLCARLFNEENAQQYASQ